MNQLGQWTRAMPGMERGDAWAVVLVAGPFAVWHGLTGSSAGQLCCTEEGEETRMPLETGEPPAGPPLEPSRARLFAVAVGCR
jgi:hypothetical protein